MNTLQERFISWRPNPGVETQHAVAFFREVLHFASLGIPRPTARVAEPLRLRQITLASSQGFFRLFKVMDIRIGAVPSEGVSRGVNQRVGTPQEPTVGSIGPSETRLYLTGFSLRYECSPLAKHPLNIIGMHHSIPARSDCLFERHSRVVHPATIHKIDYAVRTLGPELGWHGIDNQTSPILSPLAFGYVDDRTDVFHEIAGWAENRMAYRVDVPDFTARMNDSVIQIELRVLTPCCLDRLPDFVLIVRMDALKKLLVSRLCALRIKTQHAVTLIG